MSFNEFFTQAYLFLSNPCHGSKANSIANPNPSYICQLDICKVPEARSHTKAKSKAIPLAEIYNSSKNAKLSANPNPNPNLHAQVKLDFCKVPETRSHTNGKSKAITLNELYNNT